MQRYTLCKELSYGIMDKCYKIIKPKQGRIQGGTLGHQGGSKNQEMGKLAPQEWKVPIGISMQRDHGPWFGPWQKRGNGYWDRLRS